jgi:membrane fusion protein (multidrug efflux system)
VGATLRSYEQASRDYDRNENANLISQQALDAMRLTRDTARSDHESAKLAVLRSAVETRAAATTIEKAELAVKRQELEQSWTRIVAPFAGVIASRSIKVGDAATAGAPMFVLTDLDHLRAVFHRPQRELGMFLAAGDGASASDGAGTPESRIEIRGHAEALPGRELAGEILLVSPSIDAQSGSFRVTVRLHPRSASGKDESAARLLPGMLVRLETVTDRHPDALVVPKRALRREGEASLLFVVRDGIAHRVEVTEGYTDDTSVEVVPVGEAILAAGDSVVVVGNRDLEQGSEVIAEGQEK